MTLSRFLYTLFVTSLLVTPLQAQDYLDTRSDSLESSSRNYSAAVGTGLWYSSSNKAVPFWMRSNRFGNIPQPGASPAVFADFQKQYDKQRALDWSMGIHGRANLGKNQTFYLIEAYATAKAGIFELKGGRSMDQMGLGDSTLSIGNFAVSGNALGIPKAELSIPQFWTLPFLNSAFAIKGNISFGWFGSTPLVPYEGGGGDFNRTEIPAVNSKYHQKSFHVRLHKPNWKLALYGGFNHQVMFGNEDKIFTDVKLSNFQTYRYAFTGKTYFNTNGASSKLGNHIGSIDLMAKYEFEGLTLSLLRQQFYDVGALAHLANIRDGLTGIYLENSSSKSQGLVWSKILFEFMYSKNQAGELWSKITPSGDEDYYNNFLYRQGWSYKGQAIGNPLFTLRKDARPNLVSKQYEEFINNRIIAMHIGVAASIEAFDIKCKFTYSENYGTYGTSPIGSSRGRLRFPLPPPYFQKVKQFSGLLNVQRTFIHGWSAELEVALDAGRLLSENFGSSLSIKKQIF